MLEEVQQLRRLARRGEERARLNTLIDTLSAQAPGVQLEAAAEVRSHSDIGCVSCVCVQACLHGKVMLCKTSTAT